MPAPLNRLAKIDGPVHLQVDAPVTQNSVLDALEARYPMLRGTLRDQHTRRRRAYVRFFACNRDLSDAAPDEPLPDAVVAGVEPYLVVGALSGG